MKIQRLIEMKKDEFLLSFLDEYKSIFKYHEYYLTFLSNLLLCYADKMNPKIKKKLLEIGLSNGLLLTNSMIDFMNQQKNDVFQVENDYFFEAILKVSKFIPTHKNYQNSVKLENIFQEFNSEFDIGFHSLLIEFLSIPNLSISNLTKKLLGTFKKNVSFDYIHTLMLLLSSLSEESFDEIFNFSKEFLENEKKFYFLNVCYFFD